MKSGGRVEERSKTWKANSKEGVVNENTHKKEKEMIKIKERGREKEARKRGVTTAEEGT